MFTQLSTLPHGAQALYIFQTFCTLFGAHLSNYQIARLAYAFVIDGGRCLMVTFEGDITMHYDTGMRRPEQQLRVSWSALGSRSLDETLAYAQRMEAMVQIVKNFELALPFLKTADFGCDLEFQLKGLAHGIWSQNARVSNEKQPTDLRARFSFTKAALENIEETGVDPLASLTLLRDGSMTELGLFEDCARGADEDRMQGWREYAEEIARVAAELKG